MEKTINPIADEVVEFFFKKVKLIKEQPSVDHPKAERELVFINQNCPYEIPYRFDRTDLIFYTPLYGETGPLGLFLYFFERFAEKDEHILISSKKLKKPISRSNFLSKILGEKKEKLEVARISPFHFSNQGYEKTTQELWIEENFVKRLYSEMLKLPFESNYFNLEELTPDISICLNEYTKNAAKDKEADLEIPFTFNKEEIVGSFIRNQDEFVLDKLYDNTSSLRKANYSFYAFERILLEKAKEGGFHFLTLPIPVVQRNALFKLYGEVLKNKLKFVIDEEMKSKIQKYSSTPTFRKIKAKEYMNMY